MWKSPSNRYATRCILTARVLCGASRPQWMRPMNKQKSPITQSRPTSTGQSQVDPGAADARESLNRDKERMLEALNDRNAVQRGEERFEEGLDDLVE